MSGRLWLVRLHIGGRVFTVRSAMPIEPTPGDVIAYGDADAPLRLRVAARIIPLAGPPFISCDLEPCPLDGDELAAELERLRFRLVR